MALPELNRNFSMAFAAKDAKKIDLVCSSSFIIFLKIFSKVKILVFVFSRVCRNVMLLSRTVITNVHFQD